MTSSSTRASVAGFSITIDVEQLDRSRSFYTSVLGFGVVRELRPGMYHAGCVLTHAGHPGVRLELREAFGKRVHASQPGGLLRFGLPVSDVESAAASLAGKVRWVGEPPKPGATSIRFVDPDGYVIELYRPEH